MTRGLSRRRFLGTLGALAVAPACAPGPRPAGREPTRFAVAPTPTPIPGVVLNDAYSGLNATRVAHRIEVDSLGTLHAAILRAREEGRPISVSGGLHALGGQQLAEGGLHLDTRGMSRVLGFDRRAGFLKVEAGIQWPDLVGWTVHHQSGPGQPWGIAQKQTGADRFTIGGSLAANAHGRGLAMKPMVADVESLTLIDGGGGFRDCSRSENEELFRLAIGGYGLFGVIYSVRLRLSRRQRIRRVVELRSVEGLMPVFAERIRDGYLYGDFDLDTDDRSEGFLRRGILTCHEPVPDDTAMPDDLREPSVEQWRALYRLAHTDKPQFFDLRSRYALSTNGRIEWTDTSQLSDLPVDDHHGLTDGTGASAAGSEMITELYVPRGRLEDFLAEAARELRTLRANVVSAAVRLIERDRETFLAWARGSHACVMMSLHVDHSEDGLMRAQVAFRMLIDLARTRGGTFFLTYHRWATREQLLDCHPGLPEFLRLKRRYDPEERFQSEWYRHVRTLLA